MEFVPSATFSSADEVEQLCIFVKMVALFQLLIWLYSITFLKRSITAISNIWQVGRTDSTSGEIANYLTSAIWKKVLSLLVRCCNAKISLVFLRLLKPNISQKLHPKIYHQISGEDIAIVYRFLYGEYFLKIDYIGVFFSYKHVLYNQHS